MSPRHLTRNNHWFTIAQKKHRCCPIGVLRFKISFMEQGRGEELGKVYLQTLAQLVDDPQLHGWVRAVEQIANGGLGNSAFHI